MPRDMPVRKLSVDLSKPFPRYWHGGDVYRTCLFNAFSFSFPILEDYISEVVKSYAPALNAAGETDLELDVQAFVGQEVTHRFMHQKYNAQLERQGFSNWVEHSVRWRTATFRRISNLSKLAIVAGSEHVMAALSDGVLRSDEWLEGADPEIAKIWRWHAAEETEHKSVAYDVYLFAGGGYMRRVIWYLLATMALFVDLFIQTSMLLRQEKALWRWSTWRSGIRYWLIRPGIFWHLLPLWLSYLAPRFYPWKHDNNDIVEAWRQRSADDVRIVKAAPSQRSAKRDAG